MLRLLLAVIGLLAAGPVLLFCGAIWLSVLDGAWATFTADLASLWEHRWGWLAAYFFLLVVPACLVHLLNTWVNVRRTRQLAAELDFLDPSLRPPPRAVHGPSRAR